MRVFLDDQDQGIEIPDGESILGRDLACRIRFNDPTVSRRHLLILVKAGSVSVEDLGSRNGSAVNDAPLSGKISVRDGDRLRLGGRQFRIRIVTQPERPQDATSPRHLYATTEEVVIPLTRPVAHTCPRCRDRVAIEQDYCGRCGHHWPSSARPFSVTQQFARADRRRAERRPIEIPLLYTSDTLTFDAVARDLSRQGIFVATELLDPAGTPCRITALPDGAPAVVMEGVVARVVEVDGVHGVSGLGIRFTSLPRPAAAWLDQMLAAAG